MRIPIDPVRAVLTACSAAAVLLWAPVNPTLRPAFGQIAEEAGPAAEQAAWQLVISAQIEALRKGDSEAALAMAASGFRETYPDPDQFYFAILQSGYEPIVLSQSHSFRQFRMIGKTTVMQLVQIVGPDHGLYEALYRLELEPIGWRILAVALKRQAGVGV